MGNGRMRNEGMNCTEWNFSNTTCTHNTYTERNTQHISPIDARHAPRESLKNKLPQEDSLIRQYTLYFETNLLNTSTFVLELVKQLRREPHAHALHMSSDITRYQEPWYTVYLCDGVL